MRWPNYAPTSPARETATGISCNCLHAVAGLAQAFGEMRACLPPTRAEGFFGRLKMEFFYGRDWSGVALDEFADMLDAHLRWYRDVRLKSDLGYKSPMQYRRDLGLIA